MRRSLVVIMAAVAVMVLTAVPAFAAHCVNLSKPAGAGTLTQVLINPFLPETDPTAVTIVGDLHGGYAEIWLDFDTNGVVSEGDVFLEEVQIGKNHSPQTIAGEWINPGAINKAINDHATKTHGIGFPDEP